MGTATRCFGAISLRDGAATLFVPRQPDEYAVWMGAPPTLEEVRATYKVCGRPTLPLAQSLSHTLISFFLAVYTLSLTHTLISFSLAVYTHTLSHTHTLIAFSLAHTLSLSHSSRSLSHTHSSRSLLHATATATATAQRTPPSARRWTAPCTSKSSPRSSPTPHRAMAPRAMAPRRRASTSTRASTPTPARKARARPTE